MQGLRFSQEKVAAMVQYIIDGTQHPLFHHLIKINENIAAENDKLVQNLLAKMDRINSTAQQAK